MVVQYKKFKEYHLDKGSLQKKKTEIYWSFTNPGSPPSPL